MSRRPAASVTAAGTATPGRPKQGLTLLEGRSPYPVSGAPA